VHPGGPPGGVGVVVGDAGDVDVSPGPAGDELLEEERRR
jgi:hypothetical protein